MRAIASGLLDLFLPPICSRCGRGVRSEAALCEVCERRLPRCNDVSAPPELAACVAGFEYSGEGADWIRRFKYPIPGLFGLDPAALCVLRWAVREAARRVPDPIPQLIVPIPLHPRRLRARGFNPAALLARFVAREVGARLDCAGLVRVRETTSQTGLGRSERARNLRGAFRVRRPRTLPDRIWLVDDVVTTGATLTEAARSLRRSGAKSVTAVCAARTPAEP